MSNNIKHILSFLLALTITTFLLSQHKFYVCDIKDFTEENLFYKIIQDNDKSWRVNFKNVNKWYWVTSIDTHLNSKLEQTRHFKFTECAEPDQPFSECVKHNRFHANVKIAVMEHFNDIQRGKFHPECPNVINPNAHGKNIKSPLDQFFIKEIASVFVPMLGGIRIAITSMAIYLTISAFISIFLSFLSSNWEKIMPHNWSITFESIYATIHSIVVNQINNKIGQAYYPFMYSIFTYILISNLIGMVPYNFASTSHFILTFFLSFTVVLGSTILGLILHKLRFFSLFVPSGCPLGLLPLLVLIELISYAARNISLGLRLAANILSGHMLLNILSEFTYKIFKLETSKSVAGIVPLLFIMAFSALELSITFIQSQVFTVLSASYIKDGLLLH